MTTKRGFGAPAGARLAAEGIAISLKGQPHRLRYAMRAHLLIEDEYGSLQTFAQKLGGEGRLRAITVAMIAGLLHEKPTEMALEVFQEQVIDLLDGESLNAILNVITLALAEAFPALRPGQKTPKAKGSRRRSPGIATTSSRPSATAAATRRSGR